MPKKVLLIDDDPTMVHLLKTLLGLEGYHVDTLMDKDGDPLSILREAKPDIVLMDVFLGSLNGVDLVRTMRSHEDLRGIRVIMTSGMEKGEECLAAGADAFLLKPYNPDDLIHILKPKTAGY